MYQVGQQVSNIKDSEPPLFWHCELLSWKDFVKMEPPPSSLLTAGRQLAGGHVDCLNCWTYIISVVILRNVVPLLNTNHSIQIYTHIKPGFQSPSDHTDCTAAPTITSDPTITASMKNVLQDYEYMNTSRRVWLEVIILCV